MRLPPLLVMCVLGIGASTFSARAQDALPPIDQVEIGEHREFRVNGEPFLPIMSWLQAPRNYQMLRGLGINTFCGTQSDMTAASQCRLAQDAGGYAVPAFGKEAVGHSYLLGWIHGDEPDMPREMSNANVQPAANLTVNPTTPFSRVVDGVGHSWTVVDPLAGGEFTIRLDHPVTVVRLAIALTVSGNMPVAREVVFLGDGEKIATASLEKKKGDQAILLDEPATFRDLTVRVTEVYEGEQKWGSIGEVKGFDAEGNNVLLSPPYWVPRHSPDEIQEHYAKIKAAGSQRPVCVTFTAHFTEQLRGRFSAEMQREIYPAFAKGADVLGFDFYPIYGYGTPGKLNYPAHGTAQLVALGGRRPVYAWIEAQKGSKWMSFEKQPDVLPKHTRYEVWSVIIEGATAVGFFTHAWRPEFKEFAPTEAMRAELERINAQLTRLAPAILAAPATADVDMRMKDGFECHLKATETDDSLWIFAQNMDLGPAGEQKRQFEPISPRGGEAVISVEGLAAETRVAVVDEDRTVTSTADGTFSDMFPPLGEHIYRIDK